MQRPKGLLLDYGGTLVRDEHAFDSRAGNEWLLARAVYRPSHVTLEHVLARADRVARELTARRDQFHLEVPWPSVTRLIHHFLGVRFADSMPELEIGFWQASSRTKPAPGAREALEQLHRTGVPIAVVSNCAYGEHVVRWDLEQHGLADCLAFIMVSADYSARKPNALLFDTAAARLGVEPQHIWFIGDRLDTDIVGAKAAGMTAVWLRSDGAEDTLPHDADLVVADWAELLHQYFQRETT